MLSEYTGTILLISHDRDFLDRIATSVIVPEGNGRWLEYAGGYTDMLLQRGADLAARAARRGPLPRNAATRRPGSGGIRRSPQATELPPAACPEDPALAHRDPDEGDRGSAGEARRPRPVRPGQEGVRQGIGRRCRKGGGARSGGDRVAGARDAARGDRLSPDVRSR
jgi:hypothetical protein